MSINHISAYNMAGAYSVSEAGFIPKHLQERLIELGIDPESVATLHQARELIKNAEESKSGNNSTDDTQAPPKIPNTEEGDLSIRARAELLAEKLGITFNYTTTTEEILREIQSVIDGLFAYAAKEGDKNLYEQAKGFQFELNSISSMITDSLNAGKKITDYMDMLAKYNKSALNF